MTPQDVAAKVGEQVGTSEWVEMSQERINQFADATGDHQFIHINEEAAKMTPFGGTIAHGFMTLSMLSVMAYQAVPGIQGTKQAVNYGFDRLRFVSPVPVGSNVRGRFPPGVTVRRPEVRSGEVVDIRTPAGGCRGRGSRRTRRRRRRRRGRRPRRGSRRPAAARRCRGPGRPG